ncbi:MAG: NERD domain-containing protein [Methanoregulaceae archaeon]|nr:NERD domain-containing protein [Methanoregulaceae archaeon]
MTVRFFRGIKTRFEHEYAQIREIAAILEDGFPDEPVYVLTNVLVANGEIDCVVLTRNGPLLLELKAYQGVIHGSENGPWTVDTRDGPMELPNLFLRAKMQRQDFIDRMIPICRSGFPHIGESNLKKIGSWIYFCRGSTYPEGQIDFRRVKWFRITTADTLLEKLRFLDTGYTLRPEDMDAIVAGFRLTEYSIATDKVIKPKKSVNIPDRRWKIAAIAGVLVLLVILLLIPGVQVVISAFLQSLWGGAGGAVRSISKDLFRSESTPAESADALEYLNRIRGSRGAGQLTFDNRVYELALVRAEDMDRYEYLGYTNPATGACANSMKERFGFARDESLSENAYGQWNGYTQGIERQAIDSWMSDAGNRARLLSNFSAGAVSCSGGYCTFLGLTRGEVVEGCPTTSMRPSSSAPP